MPKPNRINQLKNVVDFIPAELRMNKEWTIVYRCHDPFENKLKRYVTRVPMIKSVSERKALGKRMCLQINTKLQSGWNPLKESGKNFEQIKDVLKLFISQIEREVADGTKRIDTLRSYRSYVHIIDDYTKNIDPITFAGQISREYIIKYLDWRYKKVNSATSYNNHLNFWGNLCGWMQMRGMIAENFQRGIPRKKKQVKKRKIIDVQTKQNIKKALQSFSFNYYTLCMTTYFCFIRGTELTNLKVSDVNLEKDYIYILGDSSKNRKSEYVTIPNAFKPLIEKHIGNARGDYWLFSGNDFKPGVEQLKSKKIRDTWNKIRELANFGLEYPFYSLKDTGITDMLRTGVPSIKVRDQARHHDLKITELYTDRNINADDEIKNIKLDF